MTLSLDPGREWLDQRPDFKTSIDADEAELAALRFGAVNIEEGLRNDRTFGTILDSIDRGKLVWFERSAKLDEEAGRIADEVQRRTMLLGDKYPFKLRRNRLSHSQSKTGAYEFCLCATLSPSLSQAPFNAIPVAFEKLAFDVAKTVFGNRATGWRTGWPRSPEDKLPDQPRKLFNVIESRTGEWLWSPQNGMPLNPPCTHFKDMGLDLLVWIPMPDQRIGSFFMLGQCACGKSNWLEKLNEPSIPKLKRWFKECMTVVPPQKSFFVPLHISNKQQLIDVSTEAGLTFDRARIVSVTERAPFFATKAHRQHLAKLTNLVVKHQGPARKTRRVA